MIETESKKLRQAEWLKTHTLSKEQFKQLIQNKIDRAAKYQTASHIKREVLKSAV
jgi:methionine synthase II (cobalamin-independent)